MPVWPKHPDGSNKALGEMSPEEHHQWRNVEMIRAGATRVVRGSIPAAVRKELMAAVKAGTLGRLKKDGLKPEIFFHPDHKHGAVDRQKREAEYSVSCIAKVMLLPPLPRGRK